MAFRPAGWDKDDDWAVRGWRIKFASDPKSRSRRQPGYYRSSLAPGRATYQARCTASLGYTKNSGKSSAALVARLNYLLRKGATENTMPEATIIKSKGSVDFGKFLDGEKRVFGLVLSPEDFFSLRPEEFAEEVMKRLQDAAGLYGHGQSFDWVAVVHTNTHVPHLHFLIRGLDSYRRDVYFDPKRVVSNLHNMAAAAQHHVGAGLPLRLVDKCEFVSSRRIDPLYHREGFNPDAYIFRLPSGTSYREALGRVPLNRKRAFHSRLVFLYEAGLIELALGGRIHQVAGSDRLLKEQRELAAEFRRKQLTKYTDPLNVTVSAEPLSASFGLVTGIFWSRRRKKNYAVYETADNVPVLVPVDLAEVVRIQRLASSGVVFKLARGSLDPVSGDPVVRLKKTRARGPVVNAILARKAEPVEFLSAEPDVVGTELEIPSQVRSVRQIEIPPAKPSTERPQIDSGWEW